MNNERLGNFNPEKKINLELPIDEITINPERANVFSNIMEMRDEGRDLPKYIVQQMLKGRRVGFVGGSGNGKTTLLIQSVIEARENARNHGIDFNPKRALYDNFLPFRVNEKEDAYFNRILYNAYKNSDVFENPGVGLKSIKDRGVTAQEEIMTDMKRGEDDTLLVHVTMNPSIQMAAGFIRSQILEADPKNIFDELEKFNIHIKGVLKNEDSARRIRNAFRVMGKSHHMDTIRNEQKNIDYLWGLEKSQEHLRQFGPEENRNFDIFSERKEGMNIPEPQDLNTLISMYQNQGFRDIQMIKQVYDRYSDFGDEERIREAIYMEDKFRYQYKLNKDQAVIVFNNLIPTGVEMDFSIFTSAA